VSHSQFFCRDNSNSGFFENDRVRADDGHSKDDYSCGRDDLDDSQLRLAETLVRETWDNHWKLFSNDCHDYVNSVLTQYNQQFQPPPPNDSLLWRGWGR